MQQLVVIGLLFLAAACAQTCELFAGNPPQCSAAIGGEMILVPAGESQASVVQQSPVTQYIPILASATPACAAAAFDFFCPSILPPCVPAAAPLGKRVCRSSCDALFTGCSAEIQQYGALLGTLLPDCSAVDSSGVPLFPIDTYTVVDNGTQIIDTCYASNTSNASNDSCPPGLTRTKDGVCFFKCPLYLLTPARMRAIKILGAVASSLGTVGWVLSLLSSWIRYHKQVIRWPHSILVFIAIHGLLLNLTFDMGFFSGYEPIWCDGDKFADQSYAPCAVQGSFFVLSFYAAMWWVFWLAVNLIISFTAPRLIPTIFLEVAAHVTGSALPLITLIVGLGQKRMFYPGDNLTCALGGDSFYTYLYPMAVLVALSSLGLLVASGYVLVVGVRTSLHAASERGEQLKEFGKFAKKTWLTHWRLLVLALYSIVGLGLPAGVFLYQQDHKSYVEKLVAEQFLCLVNNGDCHPDTPVPYAVLFLTFLVVFGMGIVFGAVTFEIRLLNMIKALIFEQKLQSSETQSSAMVVDESASVGY